MYKLKERKLFGFVPLFFAKAFQKVWARGHVEPTFFDEFGVVIPICSTDETHGWFFTRADKRLRCFYCRQYRDDLFQVQVEDSVSTIPPLRKNDAPQPDYNSITTLTLNLPSLDEEFDVPDVPKVDDFKVESMELFDVEAYCLRCKTKTIVVNPSYEDIESRKGIRRYLRGKCSICDSKMNAIVKRGTE